MDRRIWISTVIASAMIAGVGCENTPPPEPKAEETQSTMLTLKAQKVGSCPELKGTYACTAGNKTENASIWIKEYTPGVSHLVFGPDNPEKMSFSDFLVESFAMDKGGFIADGKIHDKAEPVRKGLEYLVTVAAYTVVPPYLKSFAFDLKAEIKRIDVKKFPVGYVSSCDRDRVILHYVAGKNAFKAKITKKDDEIVATIFTTENGGPVAKSAETCTLVSDEVRLRKPISELIGDLGQTAQEKVAKVWNYPGTINIELEGSAELVGNETITLKFDRSGYISGRHLYNLDKAFLGPTDDVWLDDVEVKIPWNRLVINMETLEVFGGHPGTGGEKVGALIGEAPNYKLRFEFNKWSQKYNSRVLEIGPTVTN